MAAEYQVNIKLNTQQFKTELGKLQNVVKDAGTINLAPTKQQTSALKLQTKEVKEQSKQAKTLLQLESQRNANDRQRQRLWHAADVLEQKAVKTTKIRKTIGERATALQKEDLLLAKQKGHVAEKLIKNAQHNLRLERLKTAEIRKQQNQGLALRRLGDRAGRISRRAGPQLALPSSQLIQEQRSAEFTARANERTARAYARSAERGKEVLEASQASAKAAEQHYRWVEKRGAVGAPSSPLNVVGGRVRPGRQGWLSRMQQQNPGRFQLGAAGQGAMISGAFPLLFGQGPGVAGAGALGGGLGGFLGGQGGAFAGGLVATAAVAQIAAAVQSTRELGEAMNTTQGTFDLMTKRTLFSSDAIEAQAKSLLKQGRQTELAKLLSDDLAMSLGVNAVGQLKELGAESKEATRQWAILTTQLQLLVAGPLADMLRMVTELLGRQTAERSLGEGLRSIREVDPDRARELVKQISRSRDLGELTRGTLLHGTDLVGGEGLLNLGGADIAGMSDEKLRNWVTKVQDAMKELGIGGDTVGGGVLDNMDKQMEDVIGNLDKQIALLRDKGKLTESQFKIEQDILKLQDKGIIFNEEEYRQKATLLNSLEEQRRLYLDIAQTIKGGIVDGIEAAITGARSLGEVLRDITQTVGRSFLNAAINAGVGALTSSWGGGGGSEIGADWTPENVGWATNFSEGGYVGSPTSALIGEGGEGEYVIPESKMSAALANYAGGSRGESVIPGDGATGEVGGAGGGAMGGSIDVRFTSEQINSVSYVTLEQFQAGVQQAAAEGAKRGQQSTLRTLQTNSSTRGRLGLK